MAASGQSSPLKKRKTDKVKQSLSHNASSNLDHPELQRLCQFLRVRSESHLGPKGAYTEAVALLRQFIEGTGAPFKCKEVQFARGKPILIATLEGSDASLQSILLNSHYDVVPCVDSMWHHDPWAGLILDGEIYGRGVQDMKSVCMQYIEALGRLFRSGTRLLRTVHIMFVPDEEIGGRDGTGKLVETKVLEDLNVAFALDEGLANEQGLSTSDGKSSDVDGESKGQFTVFYGERAIWWLHVRAKGPTGHASRFVTRTAMEKLIACITDMLKYRAEQEAKLHGAGCKHASALKLGDVVTLNLTALQGGVIKDGENYALNVIPTDAMAGFDIRIPPSVPLEEFSAILDGWASKHDVTWEYVQGVRTPAHYVTSIDPEENVFWKTFSSTADRLGMKLSTEVFPAATDGRYLRSKGIPVLGFSPMSKTPILLHDHNERLSVDTYMNGISLYEELIRDLANTPTPQ